MTFRARLAPLAAILALAGAVAPVAALLSDIAAMRHETLDGRLFIS